MIDKLPPQNNEAEEAVLGACMLDRDALDKAAAMLGPEDFYKPANRMVYQTLVNLVTLGQPTDLVMVSNYMKTNNELELVGGAAWIAELTDKVPSSANVEYYAGIVSGNARRRRLISACMAISTQAYGSNRDDSIFDQAENSILVACTEKSLRTITPIAESMGRVIDQIEQYSKNPGMMTGVTTGFKEIDTATTGFHGGDLIIVAGRPGMGKTSLCMDMARKAAHAGVPVAIYSLEMTCDSLVKRMICAESGIDGRKLDRGLATSMDRAMITRDISTLYKLPIFIDDESQLDILKLRSKLRRVVKEKKIGLAVVDYIQLMDASEKTENRQQEITKISRGLKAVAKELNIPIIVASQLSRATEAREKSKPRLSDLRESGAIEQDADTVMLIYRPDYYDKTGDDLTATIDIAKQRSGPTGEVKLLFRNECTSFVDLDPRYSTPNV
jgi:replicative DNA helicase